MDRSRLEENKNFIVTTIFVITIILMYALNRLNPELFYSLFVLKSSNISSILPWQLITYTFVFNNNSIIFFFFTVMIFMWFSSRLESIWGSFYTFLYIIVTILLKSISSFLFGPLPVMGDYSLYLALMVAFGFNFQDEKIYLFFIIPIRVKILAIISLIFVGFNIVFSMYSIFFPTDTMDIMTFNKGITNIPINLGNLITTIVSYTSILIFYKKIFPYNDKIFKIKREIGENIQENIIKIGNNLKIGQNDKYYELITKENLSDGDIALLNEIETNPKMCDEIDFEYESEYCKICNIYKSCVKRRLEGRSKVIL